MIYTTVDGCEILHQLIGGKHAIFSRVSNILLVVPDFFHPPYVFVFFSVWVLSENRVSLNWWRKSFSIIFPIKMGNLGAYHIFRHNRFFLCLNISLFVSLSVFFFGLLASLVD